MIPNEVIQFIKIHIPQIKENTKKSWGEIYMDLEDFDGERLPGDFGKAILDAGIDPSLMLKEVPRRFLQYHSEITQYKIPPNCEYIGMSAFEDTSLKEVYIPDQVQGIDFLAFAGTQLKSIELPASVTTLENAVFHSCKDLEEVDLGQVIKMGESTFEDCINLQHVIIPNTLNILNANNFDGCTNLKRIVYLVTAKEFIDKAIGNPDSNTIDVECIDWVYMWEKK